MPYRVKNISPGPVVAPDCDLVLLPGQDSVLKEMTPNVRSLRFHGVLSVEQVIERPLAIPTVATKAPVAVVETPIEPTSAEVADIPEPPREGSSDPSPDTYRMTAGDAVEWVHAQMVPETITRGTRRDRRTTVRMAAKRRIEALNAHL